MSNSDACRISPGDVSKKSRINLNTATDEQLMAIYYVGPAAIWEMGCKRPFSGIEDVCNRMYVAGHGFERVPWHNPDIEFVFGDDESSQISTEHALRAFEKFRVCRNWRADSDNANDLTLAEHDVMKLRDLHSQFEILEPELKKTLLSNETIFCLLCSKSLHGDDVHRCPYCKLPAHVDCAKLWNKISPECLACHKSFVNDNQRAETITSGDAPAEFMSCHKSRLDDRDQGADTTSTSGDATVESPDMKEWESFVAIGVDVGLPEPEPFVRIAYQRGYDLFRITASSGEIIQNSQDCCQSKFLPHVIDSLDTVLRRTGIHCSISNFRIYGIYGEERRVTPWVPVNQCASVLRSCVAQLPLDSLARCRFPFQRTGTRYLRLLEIPKQPNVSAPSASCWQWFHNLWFPKWNGFSFGDASTAVLIYSDPGTPMLTSAVICVNGENCGARHLIRAERVKESLFSPDPCRMLFHLHGLPPPVWSKVSCCMLRLELENGMFNSHIVAAKDITRCSSSDLPRVVAISVETITPS